MIRNLFKNKVVFYLVSRYLTYFIHFITSLIVAAELGPYYMGIWGFILLLLNYFQQFHFGIANSFNVLYVQHRNNYQECNNYIWNSLALVGYLAGLVVCCYLYYFVIGFNGFEKYHADRFIIWVCLIAILQYFVQFFINLFRVKNLLNHVTFCQSIIILLNFACVFFFQGEQLILMLIAGYVIGNMLCVLIAFTSRSIPLPSMAQINIHYQKKILKKGIYLFLYNSCFYFIIISIRTVISSNYSVEEFGLFTFSFSLAHAVMLIMEAMSFIIFPKVIGKLSSHVKDEVLSTLNLLRTSYITTAHLLIYMVLPCFPILISFLPQYSEALTSMNLIALTILMSANSYGYLELLISRNKERILAVVSASALLINILLALVFVIYFHFSFSYVIFATMVTYYLFTLMAVVLGKSCLGSGLSIIEVLKCQFPLRLMVPYLSAIFVSIFQYGQLVIVPLFLFVALNIKTFTKMKDITKTLLAKPEVVNL